MIDTPAEQSNSLVSDDIERDNVHEQAVQGQSSIFSQDRIIDLLSP